MCEAKISVLGKYVQKLSDNIIVDIKFQYKHKTFIKKVKMSSDINSTMLSLAYEDVLPGLVNDLPMLQMFYRKNLVWDIHDKQTRKKLWYEISVSKIKRFGFILKPQTYHIRIKSFTSSKKYDYEVLPNELIATSIQDILIKENTNLSNSLFRLIHQEEILWDNKSLKKETWKKILDKGYFKDILNLIQLKKKESIEITDVVQQKHF